MSQIPLLPGLDGILNAGHAPEALEEVFAAAEIGPVVAIDEAGRGPLAGPVVAGAVVFDGLCVLAGVDDSKRLSAEVRRDLVPQISEAARAWAVAEASAEEIDAHNILEATRIAAVRAVEALGVVPAVVLTDALTLPALSCPVVPIIKGDARVRAIGAASILAKEHRDDLMRRAARQWPQYGFDQHVGYPTPTHRARVAVHGPSTFHRLTFNGARPSSGQPLVHSRTFDRLAAEIASSNDLGRFRASVRRRSRGLPAREREELLRRCEGC